jgi:phage tail-like protein
MTDDKQISSYLEFLPAILQQDAFLGRFLLAFEEMLGGLEEQLDGIHHTFDPEKTPVEFLEWLSGWVALSLREDWEEDTKRKFLQRIVPLYRERGTKTGLEEMLHTYTGMGVNIHEFLRPLQVGVTSTVGVDTVIGSSPAHYFWVHMYVDTPDPSVLSRKQQIARAIIDQEKPAHTYYELQIDVPTMQIGVYSKVGVDTLLGTTDKSAEPKVDDKEA